ncbi:MAG: putative lipoprotein YmbA [Bradymonadia bacterium]|jgi:uncharacterized lipoprotein YmbA
MRHLTAIVPRLLTLLLTLGCTSPAVVFHALPTPEPGAGDSPLTLVVGPIRLPAYLARPYITWRSGPTRLSFDEYNRWAASLDVELLRATADRLAARLGTTRVVTWPAQDPGDAALRITLDVEQLDVVANGPARLRARYVIRKGAEDTVLADGVADVRGTMAGSSVEDALVTYAALVDGLARQVGEAIRDLR